MMSERVQSDAKAVLPGGVEVDLGQLMRKSGVEDPRAMKVMM